MLAIMPKRLWLRIEDLTYTTLGKFSRWHIDSIFLIFPRKQDLTFHANCLQWRQFAWNAKSCFLGKIRKIFQNVVCWKFFPRVLNWNENRTSSCVYWSRLQVPFLHKKKAEISAEDYKQRMWRDLGHVKDLRDRFTQTDSGKEVLNTVMKKIDLS